jgi:hypothetical protein
MNCQPGAYQRKRDLLIVLAQLAGLVAVEITIAAVTIWALFQIAKAVL